MKHTSTTTATAYSYVRFSHPEQAKGDSLRRQTAAAARMVQAKWHHPGPVHDATRPG